MSGYNVKSNFEVNFSYDRSAEIEPLPITMSIAPNSDLNIDRQKNNITKSLVSYRNVQKIFSPHFGLNVNYVNVNVSVLKLLTSISVPSENLYNP